MTFSRTVTNFPSRRIFDRVYPHSIRSDSYAVHSTRNPSSEYRFSFFFFFEYDFFWNVQMQDFLILLPSAAAQIHLQLEIGGWCKAHHQNHNCHGNCRGNLAADSSNSYSVKYWEVHLVAQSSTVWSRLVEVWMKQTLIHMQKLCSVLVMQLYNRK